MSKHSIGYGSKSNRGSRQNIQGRTDEKATRKPENKDERFKAKIKQIGCP